MRPTSRLLKLDDMCFLDLCSRRIRGTSPMLSRTCLRTQMNTFRLQRCGYRSAFPALPCTRCGNHGRQCRDQDVQVEPERMVLDIKTILRALYIEITIAAR
jgi:hypothetical protein